MKKKETTKIVKEKPKIIYVKRYSISWRQEDNSGSIHLALTDGTGVHFHIKDPHEGMFLLDILRHEKPIRYDKEHHILFAHYEETGEHEE